MSFSIAEEEIRQIGPEFTGWHLRRLELLHEPGHPSLQEVRRRFPSRLR